MTEPKHDGWRTSPWDLIECPYCHRRTLTGLCGCDPDVAIARQHRLAKRRLARAGWPVWEPPRARRTILAMLLCVAAVLVGVYAVFGELTIFACVALLGASIALIRPAR